MSYRMEDAIKVVPAAMESKRKRRIDEKAKGTEEEGKGEDRIKDIKCKLDNSSKRFEVQKWDELQERRKQDGQDRRIKGGKSVKAPSTAVELYRTTGEITQDWKAVLHPMSYHQRINMVRSIRDYASMNSTEQIPPLTSVYVRWHGNGDRFVYNVKILHEIFDHFGGVRKIILRSLCSAVVVFESIASACRVITMSNLGLCNHPLHVRWLPKAVHNSLWTIKDSVAKPYLFQHRTIKAKPVRDKTPPQAITRPSQIQCSFQPSTVKAKVAPRSPELSLVRFFHFNQKH